MSVVMWNCHSWPLDISSNVKLPCLTIRCQYRECISECEHFIWKLGSQCELHFKLGGVYLTAYLGTASENLNSHLILVSSSDKFWGGISESEHFIWKFGSQCELHLKQGRRVVYLTADLGTASENLNSHLILVSSSDKFWAGISESEHFIWKFGSQCALHLKLRGVYLTADLGTASENLNSHLILFTSSDNFWGGNSEIAILTTTCL